MFFKIKYHFIKALIILCILSNCKLQEPYQSHGIIFLENRSKKLTIYKTNKNDVIKIIGYPQIKNIDGDWIYIERVLSKGKYHELGKHKLKENNILVLNFDKYGILKSKQIVDKVKINSLNFSKDKTENVLTEKSFVQSVLQSIKQKMYSNR